MTSHAGQNQRPCRSQSRKAKISKKCGVAVGDVEIFPNLRLPTNEISLWMQWGRGMGSVGSGERLLGEIMYFHLLDHLPDFLFCFTL
jgi:hypothetical protein